MLLEKRFSYDFLFDFSLFLIPLQWYLADIQYFR